MTNENVTIQWPAVKMGNNKYPLRVVTSNTMLMNYPGYLYFMQHVKSQNIIDRNGNSFIVSSPSLPFEINAFKHFIYKWITSKEFESKYEKVEFISKISLEDFKSKIHDQINWQEDCWYEAWPDLDELRKKVDECDSYYNIMKLFKYNL